MPGQSCLVEEMGLHLRQLKVPVAFCQLDGSVAGAAPATFITEPIEMKMGEKTDN